MHFQKGFEVCLEVSLHATPGFVLTAKALEVLGAGSRQHCTGVGEALPHFIGLKLGKQLEQEVVRHARHVIQSEQVIVAGSPTGGAPSLG